MTFTQDRTPLRLQLTPLSRPRTAPQAIVRKGSLARVSGTNRLPSPLALRFATSAGQGTHDLTLYPGEWCELLLQLENRSEQLLEFRISVAGDFPMSWCRLNPGCNRLLPGQNSEAILRFQPPADFFESTPVGLEQNIDPLDYQGQVVLQYGLRSPTNSDGSFVVLPYQQVTDVQLYVRPRSLYPTFLPELYQGVDFIGRLLKIFEQAFEPTVQTLDTLWAYLDPLTSPEAFLPFLAHWVGWPLTPSLSLERQRYFVRLAMELYRWRGTRKGLRLYLHLFTGLPLDEYLSEEDKHISIQEIFGQGFVVGRTRLPPPNSSQSEALLGGGKQFHFIVRLRIAASERIERELIERIIEQEKPAFCTYELYIDSE